MAGFGENGGLLPYMVHSVRRTLFPWHLIGAIQPNQDGWTVEFLIGPTQRTRTANALCNFAPAGAGCKAPASIVVI